MVSNELQAALDAAEAAAEMIRAHYGRGIGVRVKPDTSPVTEADVLAEKAIREILSARFPAYGFYGEESGQHDMDAEAIWIVDPIDGTKCFVREIPFFSTQIALWRGGRPGARRLERPGLRGVGVGGGGRGRISQRPADSRQRHRGSDAGDGFDRQRQGHRALACVARHGPSF